jgi:glycosyltransferase involved in cell wall biosynthesis
MKVLNIGSKSIHVSSFLKRMNELDQYLFVEEPCQYLTKEKEFVFKIRSINILKILIISLKIKRTLNKINPDCIHIHQLNRFAFFVCLLSNKRIPIISTAWGSDVLIMPWKNKLYFNITKFLLKRSKYVTADSIDMISKMKEIVASDSKYIHLQYGIDYVRKENKQNIIYSNRLHKPLYRISQIISYFSEFKKNDIDDWRLVIAGEGEETNILKDTVKDLNLKDSVEFLGWLDKIQNQHYFSISKAYVSIPSSDGTSVGLLEAMSAGCIAIVSDLEVSKEWINHMENGIVEQKNENPFFHICKLNEEEVYKLNIKKLDDSNVSSDNSKEIYLKLYSSLKC